MFCASKHARSNCGEKQATGNPSRQCWLWLNRTEALSHSSAASSRPELRIRPLQAEAGEKECVDLLISYKADTNLPGEYGRTTLHWCGPCPFSLCCLATALLQAVAVNASHFHANYVLVGQLQR